MSCAVAGTGSPELPTSLTWLAWQGKSLFRDVRGRHHRECLAVDDGEAFSREARPMDL